MLMTTDERTQYILKWKHRLDLPFCAKFESGNFEVSPSIVVFQQFTPGASLSVTVTIQNVTGVISRVILTESSIELPFNYSFAHSIEPDIFPSEIKV